jgi:hypothetical protein
MSKIEKPKILLGKKPQKMEIYLKKGTTSGFYRHKCPIIFLVPEHKMHSGLKNVKGYLKESTPFTLKRGSVFTGFL